MMFPAARAVFCMFLAGGACGCQWMWGPTEPDATVQGRWIGTVHPITLYDSADNTYQGLALHIEEGTPYSSLIPPELGGGTAPILTRPKDNALRIIPGDELSAGQRVEVRGYMGFGYAWNLRPDVGSTRGELVLRRVPRAAEGQPGGNSEHLIGVKELSVLKDPQE